ncbi:MAG: hypothetical protein AB7T49_03725 [Oligoflexales bacterium]
MTKTLIHAIVVSALIASCKTTQSGSMAKGADTISDCKSAFAEAKGDNSFTNKIDAAFEGVKALTLIGCRKGILAKHTKIDPGNTAAWFAELSYDYTPKREEKVYLRLYYQSNPEIKVLDLTRTQGDATYIAKKSDLIISASGFGADAKADEDELLASGYEKISVTGHHHVSTGKEPDTDHAMFYDVEILYKKPNYPNLLRIFKIKEVEAGNSPYFIPYSTVGFEKITGVEDL